MNLINFTIETPSGKVLSRLQQRMDAKNVTLEFSPSYILPRSTTVVLVLKAEVKSNNKKWIFIWKSRQIWMRNRRGISKKSHQQKSPRFATLKRT
jgi:hypothetical protein